MSDLFHKDVPDGFVRDVFEVMLAADWHVYQILTKRPARAVRFVKMNRDLFPSSVIPAHIWIGTSVENQSATHRIRQLRKVPAQVRFLSCEPLIGPIDIDPSGIQWVIVGGESGITRRPMDPEWVRSIRDRCNEMGIAFFFKQWGGRTPKAGGRDLDGIEWNEMPSALATNS
jgi:protein gp37